MDVFEDKNKLYHKRPTKLSGNRVLRSRPRAATFVVSFASFRSRAPSRDPSCDGVMLRAEVRVRAQASHGKITVLWHLKWQVSLAKHISFLIEIHLGAVEIKCVIDIIKMRLTIKSSKNMFLDFDGK